MRQIGKDLEFVAESTAPLINRWLDLYIQDPNTEALVYSFLRKRKWTVSNPSLKAALDFGAEMAGPTYRVRDHGDPVPDDQILRKFQKDFAAFLFTKVGTYAQAETEDVADKYIDICAKEFDWVGSNDSIRRLVLRQFQTTVEYQTSAIRSGQILRPFLLLAYM